MSVFNKVIISLLAVSTAGATNISFQTMDLLSNDTASEDNVVVAEAIESNSADEQAVIVNKLDVSKLAIDVDVAPFQGTIASVEMRATGVKSYLARIETVDVDSEDIIVPAEDIEADMEQTEAITVTVNDIDVVSEAQAPVVTSEPTPEPTPVPTPSIKYPAQGTIEYELFILVNEARQANGLAPYSYRNDLASAASVRAEEITVSFSHVRPDGTDYYTVNEAIVYGENLAVGHTSAQEVFDAWMASPSHRANILDSDYTACGFALLNNGQFYWAQEFGYID